MFTNAKVVSKQTLASAYFAGSAQRGDTAYPVTNSMLKEFSHCPARWRAGYVSPDSEAKHWGSLLDCLATAPEQFECRYAVQPPTYKTDKGEDKPWSNNATVCRAWREQQAGREVIHADDLQAVKSALAAMHSDEVISAWFAASDCQVWVAGQWEDKQSGLTVPVKCLLDFVPRIGTEFDKCLGDLKTTRSAAIMPWQREAYRFGYHIQAAFYTDIYVAATGEDRNTWCWIVSESYPPYQPAKRILSQDFLTLGRAAYQRALENYCACLAANLWPGYDDTDESVQGWTVVNPEPWMAGAEQFAPRFNFDQTQQTTPAEDDGDTIP
jgi:hypothetical protein